MDAILDISKRSMMPEWHHLDLLRTMYVLPESTKKKLLNQVPGPPKIHPNSAGLVHLRLDSRIEPKFSN